MLSFDKRKKFIFLIEEEGYNILVTENEVEETFCWITTHSATTTRSVYFMIIISSKIQQKVTLLFCTVSYDTRNATEYTLQISARDREELK